MAARDAEDVQLGYGNLGLDHSARHLGRGGALMAFLAEGPLAGAALVVGGRGGNTVLDGRRFLVERGRASLPLRLETRSSALVLT